MNIKDFEYIAEIARQGSISKAANILFITQPALTKYLQKVEQELGTPLFHRVGKKFIPTGAGEIYLEKAESIIRLNSQIEQEISDLTSMRSGNIRVGITGGRINYITKVVLPIFAQKYKDIKIILEFRHNEQLITKVYNNELDIALVSFSIEKPTLNYEIIGEDELVLVVPSNHPLINKANIVDGYKYPVVTPNQWKDYNFVQLSSGAKSRYLANEYFNFCGVAPKVVAEILDVRTVIDAVSVGLGIGIFVSVPLNQHDNIRYLSLENCHIPKQKAAIITKQGIYLNSAKQDFIQMLKENYNN